MGQVGARRQGSEFGDTYDAPSGKLLGQGRTVIPPGTFPGTDL